MGSDMWPSTRLCPSLTVSKKPRGVKPIICMVDKLRTTLRREGRGGRSPITSPSDLPSSYVNTLTISTQCNCQNSVVMTVALIARKKFAIARHITEDTHSSQLSAQCICRLRPNVITKLVYA